MTSSLLPVTSSVSAVGQVQEMAYTWGSGDDAYYDNYNLYYSSSQRAPAVMGGASAGQQPDDVTVTSFAPPAVVTWTELQTVALQPLYCAQYSAYNMNN